MVTKTRRANMLRKRRMSKSKSKSKSKSNNKLRRKSSQKNNKKKMNMNLKFLNKLDIFGLFKHTKTRRKSRKQRGG